VAYDEALAQRVRDMLGDNPDITERKMFGGIAFMLSGNMAVGVRQEDLMVRVDPIDHEQALAQPGARQADMGSRPMKGWLLVGPDATAEDSGLEEWIARGLDFAVGLPPK
jgi:TfoX/Sxy family transcriptional regulator of competence genes